MEFDEEIYPRTYVSDFTAFKYKEAMRTGTKFPPIKVGVFDGKLYVLDGWHRVDATKKLGEDYIQGETKNYENKRDMFVDAVKFNATHGKQFSTHDITRVIGKLDDLDFSLEEIQNIIKVPINSIEKFKLRTIIGPNGKPVYLKGAIAKTEASEEDKIAANKNYLSVKSFDALVEQLIGLLRNNVYTETEKTTNLLNELANLLHTKIGLTIEA